MHYTYYMIMATQYRARGGASGGNGTGIYSIILVHKALVVYKSNGVLGVGSFHCLVALELAADSSSLPDIG